MKFYDNVYVQEHAIVQFRRNCPSFQDRKKILEYIKEVVRDARPEQIKVKKASRNPYNADYKTKYLLKIKPNGISLRLICLNDNKNQCTRVITVIDPDPNILVGTGRWIKNPNRRE
jgi:hypothetical protein